MKTKEINIYNFKELTEDIQQKLYEESLQHFEYFNQEENIGTLNKFSDLFNIKINNWSFGSNNSFIHWDFEPTYVNNSDWQQISIFNGLRLYKYLYNTYYNDIFKMKKRYNKNYNKYILSKLHRYKYDDLCLTGFHLDHDILKPLSVYFDNYTKFINYTLEDIIQDCLQSWLKACNIDYDYCVSFEYYKEEQINNEYEYLQDGTQI